MILYRVADIDGYDDSTLGLFTHYADALAVANGHKKDAWGKIVIESWEGAKLAKAETIHEWKDLGKEG